MEEKRKNPLEEFNRKFMKDKDYWTVLKEAYKYCLEEKILTPEQLKQINSQDKKEVVALRTIAMSKYIIHQYELSLKDKNTPETTE